MLPHLVVAVSTVVIALAALLKAPRHCACRITELIASIDVGAMAAWDGPSTAAVLQRIIPARLELRRHHPVRVAYAVPAIDIVAVAARRRAAVAMVLDFLDWGIAFVQRVSRSSQLERESHAGNACEHFEVPPGELLYPSPSLLQHCMSSTATRAEWNIQIAFTPGLTRN
jgi:hypothetical protein